MQPLEIYQNALNMTQYYCMALKDRLRRIHELESKISKLKAALTSAMHPETEEDNAGDESQYTDDEWVHPISELLEMAFTVDLSPRENHKRIGFFRAGKECFIMSKSFKRD